jgi:hypothetical protein
MLGVGNESDAQYWRANFGPGLEIARSHNQSGPRIVVEHKPLGSFLGTLLAVGSQGDLLRTKQDLSTYVSVFGEGTRLSPITQALGGIKPALRLLRLSEDSLQAASIAELAYHFSLPTGDWLAHSGFRGLFVKWGDEIQVPSMLPSGLDLSNVDLVRFGSSNFDLESHASQKDWLVYEPGTLELSAIISRQSSSDLQLTMEQLRASNRVVMVNAGVFAISYRLLDLLIAEFQSDIDSGLRLDWDPLVLSALLCGSDDDWDRSIRLPDGSINPAVVDQMHYVPDLRRRMTLIREEFRRLYGSDPTAKAVDLGEILWLDCGLHKSMYDLLDSMLDEGGRGGVVRALFGVDVKPDVNGNRIINSFVAPGAQIRNSLIVDSIVRSGDSAVTRGFVVGSDLGSVSLPAGGGILFSKAEEVRATGPRVLAYLVKTDSLDMDQKCRAATVYSPAGPKTLLGSEDLASAGDQWYENPAFGNEISFAEARDFMRSAHHYPFDSDL